MRDLSILIPTYNDVCLPLVQQLKVQADCIDGLRYEIIVADDGSTDEEVLKTNRRIEALENCHFIERDKNEGRAAIRNFLTDKAQYDWLLFIDGGHMRVCNDSFLATYLGDSGNADILYGGYCLSAPQGNEATANLRYKYESRYHSNSSASQRNKSPYADFHTSNFLIRREVMQKYRFDERFRKYGYEDVLLGKNFEENGVCIRHIDNPTMFCGYESNKTFLRKTNEALSTLKEYSAELYDYSRLLQKAAFMHKLGIDKMIRLLFKTCNKKWISYLEGTNPSLFVFKLYKLGYFFSL